MNRYANKYKATEIELTDYQLIELGRSYADYIKYAVEP